MVMPRPWFLEHWRVFPRGGDAGGGLWLGGEGGQRRFQQLAAASERVEITFEIRQQLEEIAEIFQQISP